MTPSEDCVRRAREIFEKSYRPCKTFSGFETASFSEVLCIEAIATALQEKEDEITKIKSGEIGHYCFNGAKWRQHAQIFCSLCSPNHLTKQLSTDLTAAMERVRELESLLEKRGEF